VNERVNQFKIQRHFKRMLNRIGPLNWSLLVHRSFTGRILLKNQVVLEYNRRLVETKRHISVSLGSATIAADIPLIAYSVRRKAVSGATL
jgi:hypothetical protein